jgi:hypothetical protein
MICLASSRHTHYMPVLRFILLDAQQQRLCYQGSIDGWLEMLHKISVGTLARSLIPTLGTDQFYELW